MAILTFVAVIPPFAEEFTNHRFEVSFVYPPRPIIDLFFYLLIDIPLLLVCIISGIGLAKRQRWAWFLAIGAHITVFSVHTLASITIGPDSTGSGIAGSFEGSTGRYAAILISLVALYLLSRKDVRGYIREQAEKTK